MTKCNPLYIKAHRTGLLKEKIRQAYQRLSACTLCPRACGVDRMVEELGVCKTGKDAWVSSFNPHYGEESPLVGSKGSGTIFFTHCNLLCSFCQNYDISHKGNGVKVSTIRLADMMLALQNSGCHNINFVTPSHVVPQILSAVDVAAEKGLCIPLIYNTGGYDSLDTLKLLEGVVDMYMPDFKFWDEQVAWRTCRARDYPEVAQRAVVEMHRQVGDLVIDECGIAWRGLLVRHLVLPSGLSGTRDIMRFIANNVSLNTYVNIMPQYRPCGRAHEIHELSVGLTTEEFKQALQIAEEEGITRLDCRHRTFVFV